MLRRHNLEHYQPEAQAKDTHIKASTTRTSSTHSGLAKQGWIVSLAFWFCLFLAAAMYAVVVLAPKWQTYQNLHSDHHNNQLQLVSLERDVDRLDDVVSAMQNDTEFATELARVDFGAFRLGEESLAVDENLKMNVNALQQLTPLNITRSAGSSELVRLFSEHRQLRYLTLAVSGLLVLLAFCFLIEPQSPGSAPADDSLSPLTRLMNRYRKG